MSQIVTPAPLISVVVPVRNEAGNVAPLVAEIAAALAGRAFEVIYVNDGSCSAGKVLKVQGAPRNHRRKKSCVPMSDLQPALRPGTAR